MATLDERFWTKVDRRGPDDCWEWTGATAEGYGYIGSGGRGGRMLRAHRAVWVLTFGHLRADVQVLHRCDNRRCVNPRHLTLGDHQQNMDEMKERGRARSRSVLTLEDVATIRESDHRQIDLAERYGVSQPHISRIKRGVVWA